MFTYYDHLHVHVHYNTVIRHSYTLVQYVVLDQQLVLHCNIDHLQLVQDCYWYVVQNFEY